MFTFKLVSLQTSSADNNFTAKLLARLLKAPILSPVQQGKTSFAVADIHSHILLQLATEVIPFTQNFSSRV